MAQSSWPFFERRKLTNALAAVGFAAWVVTAIGFSIRMVCFGTTYWIGSPLFMAAIASSS